MNRKTLSGKVLGENQKITVKQALGALTINAVYQCFEGKQRFFKASKITDLIILDHNSLETALEQLQEIQVLETIKGGKTIFAK